MTIPVLNGHGIQMHGDDAQRHIRDMQPSGIWGL